MSLVAIKTPEQVQAEFEDRARLEREARQPYEPAPVTTALAGYVRSCWDSAKREKIAVHSRMVDCLRRRKGEYPADKLASIRAIGSDIYMMLTSAKCRAAKAWLSDLFNPPGGDPFALEPTPVPDLPPDVLNKLVQTALMGAMQFGVPTAQVEELLAQHEDRIKNELMQEGKKRAARMQDQIRDMIVEGGWKDAFDEFIDDLVTFPAAVMKGPTLINAPGYEWAIGQDGQPIPVPKRKLQRKFSRVSPFDFFPGPGSRDINDTWCIERLRLTRSNLTDMRGAPGYNGEAIVLALMDYGSGGLREWLWNDGERAALEGRIETIDTEFIDALEFSGKIRGQMLIDFGADVGLMDIDPNEEYQTSVILVGSHVIRAMVNPDPSGTSDYYAASWEAVPGAFWGRALPELMSDCQDACNAAARSLINNMAISSGPQVTIDMAMAQSGADYASMYPWKTWMWNSKGAPGSRPGIDFFQPSMNSGPLMDIYERFSRYADEITGLPAYAYGSDSGAGAAKTASGLNTLMAAASKSVKAVVRAVDLGVIEPQIRKCYNQLMLDPQIPASAKGDIKIRAVGSDSLMHKDTQQARLLQLLGVTANPIDMQIVGIDGRRQLLEQAMETMDVNPIGIVPDQQEFAAKQQAQMAQQQAAAAQQQQGAPNVRQPQ